MEMIFMLMLSMAVSMFTAIATVFIVHHQWLKEQERNEDDRYFVGPDGLFTNRVVTSKEDDDADDHIRR